ncbi:MAG: hypothetical protein QOI80_3323, partial [Solirubrobacteraceae bacterium]|nr:hypothetical protein [Solirubrobacteraceae bacterium]
MAEVRVHAFAAYLQDDADPQADAVTGALTQAGPHRGQESIRFNATDVGAGVFRASIDVKQEGQAAFDTVAASVIDDNGGKCQPVEFDTTTTHLEFVHAVPCRLQVSADLDLDTASLPDGDHQLRVAVEDAAGNATTVDTGELEEDNSPPPAVIDAPGISGVPRQDATLHGNQGTWTGAANTYTFQWLRCASEDVASCAPIPGAQAADYRPAVADLGRLLRFEVTTTNREGTTTAASAAVGPIARADDTTPTPTPTATATPSPSTRGDANGANASDHARLTLTGPRTRTLALGHSAETTLTLRDENGKPISGASVAVLQRMAVPGAQWVAAHSPVITDSDGRVRYLIEPAYSRGLRFAYRSHAGDPQFSAVRDLTLRVRSKTTLRTNRRFLHNGQTVRFLGRLVSRPVPAAGVVIDLQARVGRHWQTFTTIRTRADGRWHAGYRFRSTTGFQTYVFRARVRGDTGFPYTPSISARTRVHVRG